MMLISYALFEFNFTCPGPRVGVSTDIFAGGDFKRWMRRVESRAQFDRSGQ